MRKPTKKPLRFASYLRCSTDDQSFGDFTTIDTQRAINKERIEQLGGELIAEYNDEGKTGTNLNRAEWRRMLADAGRRKFDGVVVTYMSRLARGEAYHVAEYLLKEEKVVIELVQEHFTPDLAGQMNKNLKIFMDGMYPKQVSEWTKTKQSQMVKMGYHTGGMRPFGYATETVPGMAAVQLGNGKIKPAPKRLVPHPEEAPLVKAAYEMALASRSIADVQRFLREKDQTRRWPMSLVTNLLTTDKYIGVARFGQNVNPSAHEAIIQPELFAAVQVLLAHPDEALVDPRSAGWTKGREKDETAYYLRGLIFCGNCGGRMTPAAATGRTGSRVPYYECLQAQKNGKSCPIKRVNAHAIHDLLLTELATCASHPSRLERLYTASLKDITLPDDGAAELKKIRRNVRETEKKIGRIVEAIKAMGASSALTQELRELEGLKEKQESTITALEAARVRRTIPRPDLEYVTGLWGGFLSRWAVLTQEERTLLLRLVVDRVDLVAKNKATIWLSIGTEPDGRSPSLFSQSDDACFADCDSFSAGVYRSMKHRRSAKATFRLLLSIPSLYRRRRGITDDALIEHALRSSSREF